MPTTPNHALPYPALTDTADGPAAFQALAAALDALLPTVGDVKASYQTADHSGWLICDGRNTLLRASYPTAFVNAMLAAGFTGSDGTHFGVPDLRGRSVVGKGTHTDVDALSDNDGQAVASRRPKHGHTVNGHTHTVPSSNGLIAGDIALVDPSYFGGFDSEPTTTVDRIINALLPSGAISRGGSAVDLYKITSSSAAPGTDSQGPAYQVANFFVFAGA